MLSAGERPQPPVTPAIVDAPKISVMPDLESSVLSSPLLSSKPSPMPVQHIWVVTGPAGCGKSTVGQVLRKELGVSFLEGDDYHSSSNKAKMGSGTPLTDEDRWDWLIALRKAAIDALSPSDSGKPPTGVVVACSALKQKYRDVIRVAAYSTPSVQIHFIYLKLTENVLMQRVSQRQSHYMKSDMVRSQLQVLEEPQNEPDSITINVEGTQEEVQRSVLEAVAAKLAESP